MKWREIELRRVGEESRYNAKSIIMLLALGLGRGERAVLTAHGPDEREAVEALAALVDGFSDNAKL